MKFQGQNPTKTKESLTSLAFSEIKRERSDNHNHKHKQVKQVKNPQIQGITKVYVIKI